MRYRTAAAFRRALEDRLRAHSRERGIALTGLRKQLVFDRLLARLLQVARGRWVLKGALALDFRFPDAARATSTRPKDLIDILLVASIASLEADRFQQALATTFERRGTHSFPDQLPKPPEDWRGSYARLARAADLSDDLSEAYERAARFVDPILRGVARGQWDPLRGEWME